MIISGLFCLAAMIPQSSVIILVDINTIGKKQETHFIMYAEPETQDRLSNMAASGLLITSDAECEVSKTTNDRYCNQKENGREFDVLIPTEAQMQRCINAIPNIKLIKKELQKSKKGNI